MKALKERVKRVLVSAVCMVMLPMMMWMMYVPPSYAGDSSCQVNAGSTPCERTLLNYNDVLTVSMGDRCKSVTYMVKNLTEDKEGTATVDDTIQEENMKDNPYAIAGPNEVSKGGEVISGEDYKITNKSGEKGIGVKIHSLICLDHR
ncbi:MAG: hypothetical protein F6J92_38080 [Symploca sp. SIO1A3]|nr:hypothetical protein [Symploca sp. SIO2C1]NER52351.1 hypothetical protein [Symploca sp. SIO1A3]